MNDLIQAAAAKALNTAMSELYHGDVWLTAAEARRIGRLGLYFLRAYKKLAFIFYQHGYLRFPTFPKGRMLFHTFHGLFISSKSLEYVLNPVIESTPMDEDFLGKVSRASRRVGTRQISKAALQRYLVQCQVVWSNRLY